MSRRTNVLLFLALAAGVAYGWFGVPFLLPLVSDEVDSEDLCHGWSEADEIRFRMKQLRHGMRDGEVVTALDLTNKLLDEGGTGQDGSFFVYRIDQKYTLRLDYDLAGLAGAELCDGEQMVESAPVAKRFLGIGK